MLTLFKLCSRIKIVSKPAFQKVMKQSARKKTSPKRVGLNLAGPKKAPFSICQSAVGGKKKGRKFFVKHFTEPDIAVNVP